MSGRHAHRAANRRALLIFVLSLALLVTATGFVVGMLQGRFLRDDSNAKFQTELALLGELAIEPLLRSDYATVERLVDAWVQRRPEPMKIAAVTPNGYTLANAQNRDTVENTLAVDLPVEFNGRQLLTLHAITDVSAREQGVSTIARNAALTGALLVTVLGWVMWSILQRTAIRPLEDQVAAREQKERELQQRTGELESAIRELESFSYSVSHDLRTPLRAIDGFSLLLSEDYAAVLDPTAQQYLARTRAAAQRMGQLIDDLLGLAQMTHQGLHPTDIDLGALARDSLQRLAMTDPQRSVDIRIGESLHAHADRQLMAIVLDNLLGNAWKYTSHRENARIEFDKHVREGQTVFFVRDNGTGFDMRYASKLFMPFQRLHGSDYPGTGIGLATVQRIIRRHGGQIWARAMPDQGATFHFTLPLTPAAAKLPA
ncbi:MAG: ATP-binding protein [Thiobacillus sp.]|nr:ATP-binding protein [Thiobacillus sp.]